MHGVNGAKAMSPMAASRDLGYNAAQGTELNGIIAGQTAVSIAGVVEVAARNSLGRNCGESGGAGRRKWWTGDTEELVSL